MNQFICSIAVLLLSADFMQGALAQFNVSGPGFIPDENGTNPDQPQVRKGMPAVTAGAIVKDCADCPEMVVIPAGSFLMGSDKQANEQPIHSVTLRSFLIAQTEVTQEQWERVMGNNPSENKGRMLPVERVSWDGIQQFISKLNQKTQQKYRLPSEAEWEYAARAGITTEWSFGNDESKLGNYAWYRDNSGGKTHEVGRKLPNAFGLFDMHGNVYEWTQDCWHQNYFEAPTDGSAWVTNCNGTSRVLRGGSWNYHSAILRSSQRERRGLVDYTHYLDGFRLARDI